MRKKDKGFVGFGLF